MPARRRDLHAPRAGRVVATGLATWGWAALALAAPAGNPVAPADTVLRNGTILTLDARDTKAYVIAIREGRIVYVGNDAGSKAYIGPATHVTDLHSHLVMPGLVEGGAVGAQDGQGKAAVQPGADQNPQPAEAAIKALRELGITTFPDAAARLESLPSRFNAQAGRPREAILRGITINAAHDLHQDADVGSLEPGKAANLIVLDRNVLTVPAEQIGQVKVLSTVLGGKEVFRARSF